MEASNEISEITKIKKADNASTLKDNDKSGRDEVKLMENVEMEISTESEKTNPAMAPKMAKEFPHQFAIESFFLKAKEPNAPAPHNMSTRKKISDNVNRLNIFIMHSY